MSKSITDPQSNQIGTPDFIPSVNVKMARAAEVQQELQQQISQFLASGRFGVDYQRESEETWLLRLRMEETPPLSWGALVGDIIHNLRSSLDHALFTYLELASPAEFSQLSDEVKRKIQFPIFDAESDYQRNSWHAYIPANQLRSDLLEIQPFHFAQFMESEDEKSVVIKNSPLANLRDLSNTDKHRGLHLVVAGLDLLALGLNSGQVSDWQIVDQPPWQNGSRIFRVTVKDSRNLEKLNLSHSFEIALESDSRPLNVYSIQSKLDSIRSKVDWCHWLLCKWHAHISKTGK